MKGKGAVFDQDSPTPEFSHGLEECDGAEGGSGSPSYRLVGLGLTFSLPCLKIVLFSTEMPGLRFLFSSCRGCHYPSVLSQCCPAEKNRRQHVSFQISSGHSKNVEKRGGMNFNDTFYLIQYTHNISEDTIHSVFYLFCAKSLKSAV